MCLVPLDRFATRSLKALALIALEVSEPVEQGKPLGIAGAIIHALEFIGGADDVVLGSDDQQRPRRDAVDY